MRRKCWTPYDAVNTDRITTDASERRRLFPYGVAVACTAAATLLAMLLERTVQLRDPALIFLAGVLLTAMVGGLKPSMFTVLTGLLSYDYFFVEPRHTLAVNQPEDLVSLTVFLAVAVLASRLTARIREQGEAAAEREAHATAMYSFSRDMSDCVGLEEVMATIGRRLSALFDARVVILLSSNGQLAVRAVHPAGTELAPDELADAAWAWTDTFSSELAWRTSDASRWLKLSMSTGRGEVAVVALDRGPGAVGLTSAQASLLDALVRQAAVSIERCNVDPLLDEVELVDQIIEASDDGIWVLDADARVVHVNTMACLMLAMDRTLVIGKTLEEVAENDSRYARMADAARSFLVGQGEGMASERPELTVFLRGRDHHYLVGLAPCRLRRAAQAGAIVSLQDVTYVRDQEGKREALVATLSHELRTPLTSLRMAIERIRRGVEGAPSEYSEIADTAYEDVLRLQEVAQEFLDLARRRAVVARIDPRPLDVPGLIERSVKLVSLQAADKHVAIETSTTILPPVSGDETKLTWALSNLLTNAVRHTPAGGTVRITSSSAEHAVAISVADTGPGIPLEEQRRIFEPFAQSPASGEVGATGLGLAIVRDIVGMHGGRIELQSGFGNGTCFTIKLPEDRP